MSKYQNYQERKRQNSKEIHPIWRGIGFAMIIIIPIISCLGSILIIDENLTRGWFALPYNLLAQQGDPVVSLIYSLKLESLIKQPYTIYIILIIMIALTIFLSAVFTMFSFILFRIFGKSRYGPYDVPETHYKRKKKLY